MSEQAVLEGRGGEGWEELLAQLERQQLAEQINATFGIRASMKTLMAIEL